MEIKKGLLSIKKGNNFKTDTKKYIINNRNIIINHYIILLYIQIIFLISKIINISTKNISFTGKLNLGSEIIITIKGGGEQSILSNYFQNLPDQIYVNGEYKASKVNKIDGLTESENENIIKLIWNTPLITFNYIFAFISNIKKADFSNIDTSGVTDMEGMFINCFILTSVDFSNVKTSLVTRMDCMFYNCASLNNLNLSSFNTSSVTTLYAMFYNCRLLTSLDLGHFDTHLVNNIAAIFHNCTSLQYLNINNFDTSLVTDMNLTFYNCISLTSLNIRKFNTSLVKNMKGMFGKCQSLISLDLSNFQTSSVTNMNIMFEGCKSLLSLDLSTFNISLVNDMNYMFSECNSLIYLNLISFNEIKTQEISLDNMFININEELILCLDTEINQKIKEEIPINILNNNNCEDVCFQDSIKININNKNCINDCQNTNYKYEYKKICYENCPENTLISPINKYLCLEDLYCNKLSKLYNYELTECIDELPEGYYINDEIKKTIDKCHSDCKTCSNKADEYSSNCLSCFYPKIDDEINENNFINCYKDPEYYYLDKDIYRPCYETCKSCTGVGDLSNNNCIECKANYSKVDNNNNNCYGNCKYYYYFDSLNIYHCTEINKCPKEYKNLIKEKNKCIKNCFDDGIYKCEMNNICYKTCPEVNSDKNSENLDNSDAISDNSINLDFLSNINNLDSSDNYINSDNSESSDNSDIIDNSDISDNSNNSLDLDIISQKENQSYNNIVVEKECPEDMPYQLQNNECSNECNAIEFFNNECKISNNNSAIQEKMIEIIKVQLSKKELNTLLLNVLDGEKKDLLIKAYNTTYQITTTENQNNKNYTNISTIKLQKCEDRLKSEYGIDTNKSLIIFKIDYYVEGLSIPVIGYELYHPDTKIKLDLKKCEDVLVELNIPVSIDENILFKYDPNNKYYTDECFTYTSENGTDVILNDRKEEFINYNMSLCENNCSYNGYNEETKKASCKCEVKSKEIKLSEIFEEENILSNNFTFDDNSKTNLITMKCASTLFTKNGLLTNIANYILLFCILLFVILFILYLKLGSHFIDKDIEQIISEEKKFKYSNNILKTKTKIKKKRKKTNKKTDIGNPLKKKSNTNYRTKTQIKSKKSKKTLKSFSKIELKNTNILINVGEAQSSQIGSQNGHIQIFNKSNKKFNKIKNTNEKIHFYDSELNSLSYQQALVFDQRTYFEYYISLIKTKHPLIFSFFPNSDYNLLVIKSSILLLSFTIYFAINTLFFNNSEIHKIYKNNGKTNISAQLPKIIYCFFISHFICCLIKYFSLSERYLLQIKYDNKEKDIYEKADKVKKSLTIKYIIFFVLGFVFLIVFWYYLSSFGAVYHNSQIYPFINTLIGLLISLLYPFVINLIPGIFRIPSLNNNGKYEYLYIISKIIQFL